MNSRITQLKTALLRKGWGSALELVDVLYRERPWAFQEWLKTGRTQDLMAISERYRTWSIYSHRTDKLPFDNDVYAMDTAWLMI